SRSERSGSGDVSVRYRGPEGPVWAYCDGAQIRQVLWNLIRNGVQASAAGSTVRVTAQTVEEEARVKIAVADEGKGIEPDAIAKIFEPFYTTRSHGAGIGLAVVRRIIEDHAAVGATIEVRSRAGEAGAGESGKKEAGAIFEVGLARAAPGTKTMSGASDA